MAGRTTPTGRRTKPLGTWHGVFTDAQGNIVTLNLRDNGLTGEIPPRGGQPGSSGLVSFPKPGDRLDPTRNSENLQNLEALDLRSNQLTGSIPPELGNFENLEFLYLRSNQLTGSIPPELGNLQNLLTLDLDSLQLAGSIPPELGNLRNLKVLYLRSNRLTGSIPPELGNLQNLDFLYLEGQRTDGPRPGGTGKHPAAARIAYRLQSTDRSTSTRPDRVCPSSSSTGTTPISVPPLTTLTRDG